MRKRLYNNFVVNVRLLFSNNLEDIYNGTCKHKKDV